MSPSSVSFGKPSSIGPRTVVASVVCAVVSVTDEVVSKTVVAAVVGVTVADVAGFVTVPSVATVVLSVTELAVVSFALGSPSLGKVHATRSTSRREHKKIALNVLLRVFKKAPSFRL